MTLSSPIKGVLAVLSALAAIVAVLAGVYWPSISRTRELWFHNANDWPEFATKGLDKKCQMLDKSLYGCEDAVVHGDYAYIACSSRESRTTWMPLAFRDAKTTIPRDSFYVYDYAEKQLTKMRILHMDQVPDLVLHGISVVAGEKRGKIALAAVNHRRQGGSCIELFDHRVGTDELIHFSSTCHPLIYAPNAVALLSRTEFYATNYLSEKANREHFALIKENLLASKTSTVVFRGSDGAVRVVKDELAGANGIAIMPNRRTLVVAETASGELGFYEIQADKSLRTAEPKLQLPFVPDNVRPIAETGHIAVAGPARAYDFARALDYKFSYGRAGKHGAAAKETATKKSGKGASAAEPLGSGIPSAVARVANATQGESRFLGQKYSVDPVIVDTQGLTLYGASVAAVHWSSKTALVGGPWMRGLAICEWPEVVPQSKPEGKSLLGGEDKKKAGGGK